VIETQPAAVNDFSGGFCDDYVNAEPSRGQLFENFVTLGNKSLLMRPGSVLDTTDPLHAQIPVGAQRISALINHDYDDALLVVSAKRAYYRNPLAYTTLTGPTGNHVFTDGDAASAPSFTQWKGHTIVTNGALSQPQKIFRDGAGVLQLRTAGLPALAADPSVTVGVAGTRNYLYAFHYEYSYQRGTETFLDQGPTTAIEVNGSGDPSVNPNSITGIPVLANGATGNWDTATIKVAVYRSIDAGTTFYRIGEVTNGTTTFLDNLSDAGIQDNTLIYTDGGDLDNSLPPRCKFVHVVNNKCYYAYIQEGTEIRKGDVLQSVDDDPDSVPAANRDTVEDEITGLSSVRDVPVVLCTKRIYRIEGAFDRQGRGFMRHVRLHDSAGCVSNNSCVQAEQALYWAGNDGFYCTDGYKVFKISDHLNSAYKQLIAAAKETGGLDRITGTFDEENRRILWAVQADTASFENDTVWCLELQWGISEEMCFETWTGGASFRPTFLTFFNKELYRADSRGYVMKHRYDIFTDPKVDLLQDEDEWARLAIIYRYKSVASNFGTDFVRKWVPRIVLAAKNLSNISIQINAINDDGKFFRPLVPIRYRNNFVWGDPEFSWGNEECIWNAEGVIEEWRRFPARGLRCSYLQIEITNAYTIVTNSDNVGTASVNGVTKQATLDMPATSDWPLDAVDYFISFEVDNYSREYLVTARTPDTLTFLDPGNTAPTGTQKWVLKGYRKDEVLNLLSYTLHYAALGKTQTNLGGVSAGGNA